MPRRIFITVAEVSGDTYAAGLAGALRQLEPSIRIEGLGGPRMASAGVTLHFETTSRAAMTFHGLARAREVWRWLGWLKAEYARAQPDLHVCVDSSGFNLHFARVARSFGVPVLYYVAPQLWASREGRIKQVRARVDRVASIFPFEAEWYRARGVRADFVGHPLFDTLPTDRLQRSSAAPRFPERPPVVGIVAGSRTSEVHANLPHLIDVMRRIHNAFPGTSFLLPTTTSGDALVRSLLSTQAAGLNARAQVDAFDEFIPQCDLCLTKSGTSTVHVAAYGVPMIVVYRVNPVLWHGVGRWMVKTRKIAMVNILAGQVDAVPEFIPWYGRVDAVAETAIDLLKHPERLTEQRRRLIEIIDPISCPGASMNVARLVMEMIAARGSGGGMIQPAISANSACGSGNGA
jgi:lipid-A-disaccharide synthase